MITAISMQHCQGSPGARDEVREEFERHVARSYTPIYQHAFRLLRHRGDAEEITQEAFLRAWKHYDSFDGIRRFENWMLRIVTNLVIDRRRRRTPIIHSLDAAAFENTDGDHCRWDPEDPRPGPEHLVLDSEISPAIMNALSVLSGDFRSVVLLADVHEYSYQEIADAMHCPVGTVRSRLRRARMKLRRSLEAAGFEWRDTPRNVHACRNETT